MFRQCPLVQIATKNPEKVKITVLQHSTVSMLLELDQWQRMPFPCDILLSGVTIKASNKTIMFNTLQQGMCPNWNCVLYWMWMAFFPAKSSYSIFSIHAWHNGNMWLLKVFFSKTRVSCMHEKTSYSTVDHIAGRHASFCIPMSVHLHERCYRIIYI